jgi:hypothetical protein
MLGQSQPYVSGMWAEGMMEKRQHEAWMLPFWAKNQWREPNRTTGKSQTGLSVVQSRRSGGSNC